MCVCHLKEGVATNDFSRAVCVLVVTIIIAIISGESKQQAQDTGLEIDGLWAHGLSAMVGNALVSITGWPAAAPHLF